MLLPSRSLRIKCKFRQCWATYYEVRIQAPSTHKIVWYLPGYRQLQSLWDRSLGGSCPRQQNWGPASALVSEGTQTKTQSPGSHVDLYFSPGAFVWRGLWLCVLVIQSCLSLCDPESGRPPGASVRGIL